jgi:hypothetical protein
VRATRQVLMGLALYVGWQSTACAHSATVINAAEVSPLRLTLSVSPKTGMAPLTVLASVRVTDERRVLDCPQFTLTWGIKDDPGYELSSFPGDSCWADGPRIHAPRPRLLRLRYAGEWKIAAAMADKGVSLSDVAVVTVIGPQEDE